MKNLNCFHLVKVLLFSLTSLSLEKRHYWDKFMGWYLGISPLNSDTLPPVNRPHQCPLTPQFVTWLCQSPMTLELVTWHSPITQEQSFVTLEPVTWQSLSPGRHL